MRQNGKKSWISYLDWSKKYKGISGQIDKKEHMKGMSDQIDIKEHMKGMSDQIDKKNAWKEWVIKQIKRTHERD